MSLVTRCPKCDSGFTVTADLLKLHDGLVRCGQCSHVFDGFACLQDNLPTLTQKVGKEEIAPKTEPLAVVVEKPADNKPQVFRAVTQRQKWVEAPNPSQAGIEEPSFEAASAPASFSARPEPVFHGRASFGEQVPDPLAAREPTFGSGVSTRAPNGAPDSARTEPSVKILGEARVRGEDPSASGRTLPDFMEQEEPETPSRTLAWLSGSIILLVALVGQLLFIYRDDLASSVPALRPALEQMCGPLNCEVGYTKRIERIFIVGSSLQLAPSQQPDNANQHDYVLRLTLQNRYDRAQPWPNLMVALSDPSGTVVIRQSVPPSQYLPSSLLERPFGGQQEASLEVPLRVQGSPISGFEIDKFFP